MATGKLHDERKRQAGEVVVTPDLPLWIAGIGIMLAVPLTFMVANWVRKNVDHGEMRFDTRNHASDEPAAPASQPETRDQA